MATINKIIRTGVLGGLLISSVALRASNPMTNVNKTPNQNQTEVVSIEAAKALRATRLQEVQQTPVTTIHNQRIEKTFKMFASNEDEKQQIDELINSLYSAKGTFLASALLQHELDRQTLFLLLEEKGELLTKNGLNPELGKTVNRIGANFYKSVRQNAKFVGEWLDKQYSPSISGLLYFDHKPNAKEIIEKIDNIAEEKANFSEEEILDYRLASDNFRINYLNNRKDNIAMSEMIAHKIFTIDKIIFKKELTENNFFGEESFFNPYERLNDYYNAWMDTVKPTGK